MGEKDAQAGGLGYFVKKAAVQGKFVGIVNGNSNNWDPRQDTQLQNWKSVATGQPMDLRFGPDTPDLADKIVTIQKELCATLKNRHFDDPAYADLDPEKPIFLYFGRLSWDQKGIDKLPMIMEEVLKNGGQFVCVGVEPDPRAKEVLERMKRRARELGKKGVLILEDRKVNGKLLYQGEFASVFRGAASKNIFPSLFEPCGLVQGESNRFGKEVIATATGGFKDTLITEGPDANGRLFKRCDNWFSPEQDEEIKKTLIPAINDAKMMMHALHHGTDDEKRPYVEKMRRISRNALNSTWEKTPDGTPSAITRLKHAYAKAFERREIRGLIPTNLKTLKV